MVCFSTGFTGQIDISGFAVNSIVCVLISSFAGVFVVKVKVSLTTAIIVFTASTNLVGFTLAFLAFELTGLIAEVIWFIAVKSRRLRFLGVWFSGLLRHSVYLQLIWSFRAVQL